MLMNKMIQLSDKVPDSFNLYACDMNCHKSPCFCKKKDPVKKFICCQMYGS